MSDAERMIQQRGAAAMIQQMEAERLVVEREKIYADCPCIEHGVRLMSARMSVREASAEMAAAIRLLDEKGWIGA